MHVPPTRADIIARLEKLKFHPNYKEIENLLWVRHARAQRRLRAVTVVMALSVAAEHRKTVTYADLLKLLHIRSSNELRQILKVVADICSSTRTIPALPVLVKKQSTGRVGLGFFKYYEPWIGDVNLCSEEYFAKAEANYQAKCFEFAPTAPMLLARALEYFAANPEPIPEQPWDDERFPLKAGKTRVPAGIEVVPVEMLN